MELTEEIMKEIGLAAGQQITLSGKGIHHERAYQRLQSAAHHVYVLLQNDRLKKELQVLQDKETIPGLRQENRCDITTISGTEGISTVKGCMHACNTTTKNAKTFKQKTQQTENNKSGHQWEQQNSTA